MSQPKWHFRVMTKGEMNADPIESEFFSIEHLDSVADALVRESIQNSLDAGILGQTVRVVFRLYKKQPNQMNFLAPYLEGLHPHLNAEQNGLIKTPINKEPERLLVIEDYGTRGLEGDPNQDDDLSITNENKKNDFFYFWRNIGRSGKSSTDRGRWGLGKTVFQATSQINSFFGMTVRDSDARCLLMGQSVLKTHLVNGKKHSPYRWFGVFDENLALPIEDRLFLKNFSSSFGLDRLHKNGLSVAIPYPDPSVKVETILPSVLLHYFFPILSKDLTVELYEGQKQIIINDQTADRLLQRLDFERSRLSEEAFHHLFSFTRWAHSLSTESFIKIKAPSATNAPKWEDALFDKESLPDLRERFDRKEKMAFRISLNIKPKDQETQETYFDVFIERDDRLEKPEDHFIREGITIAGVSTLKQKGIRAIVSIKDKALSGFLGDSENPAHTEWQERSPKFKDKYIHGVSCLRFVKNSPREIIKILSKPALGIDKKLLEDFFFVEPPMEKGLEGTSSGDQDSPSGKQEIPPGLMGETKEFYLLRRQGGFRIAKNPKTRSVPNGVLIETAYETRGRNPFSKYNPLDFKMDKNPIRIKTHGAKILKKDKNILLVELEASEFVVEVTGFDPNRDLRVKAEPVGLKRND